MAAAEVDLSYLSTHVGVPEADLHTAVSAPTAELVRTILEAVIAKVRDLEQDKFQLEIELEGAIRSSESRCEQFKATADKSLKDLEEIRQKLQDEGKHRLSHPPLLENARRSLENELQTLKSSSNTSVSEIETLRARIASLETSNRETLAIVDAKTKANADLSEELQKQHQKILKLNQELTTLNQEVQSAQTAKNAAKYREDSIKQELELAKRNNEWYDNELKTKNAEALKFRKEKGARVAELQRLNEDANSTIESLTRSEQVLRKRLEEAQSKADESLSKVQQLQEAAARAEESFKQELESCRRLVELKDQQSQTHRNRLKEVELRLEQVKDDGAEEIRRIRRELEQEKEDHVQTEQHAQEIQAELDRLRAVMESQDAGLAPPPGSAPQTPRANGTSFLGRAMSPFGTPASLRGKSSLRASDALEELYTAKGQLAGERRRNKKLQEDLDEAVGMLEAKLPEIDELSAENERLTNEAIQMSQIMEQSYEERDLASKAARKAEAAAATAQAEVKILRTQLRDLSTQIHVLIFNIHAQEKGMDQLTEEEIAQFERLQRGEVAEDALEDMSDTHQFITEKFVAFKNIHELQAKNQELLRVTRELADKMENEEAMAAKQQAAQDHQEAGQLRATVSMLQDEVKSLTVRMKSYMTERDMFRRMLQQKASAAEIHAALGTSTNGNSREILASIEQNNSPTDEADLTAALRELQAQFDSYRNDQNTDRNAMKEQIEKLSAEKSSLQSEISRISSQLTLATERYNMLESNFKAAQGEKQELQKRNQTLSESAAKQDMRTQQVAEDLVEARGLAESLRSENANLRAEKTLWKSIQDRLSQDNEILAQEKSRLNNLFTQQQSLLNERELSESETKRRLQSQIDTLDAELSTTKRKLAEEVDEGKKIQLRKEFDAQQYQKRIDELTTTISQVKEESIAVKTTRDHLQARVSELEIELRNAQERAERLRPLPTPRPHTQATTSEQAPTDSDSQARIEELENEVQELKNQLELVNAQLENTKQQSDNFKQLSREMEEELGSMSEAQEQYRQEMDAAIAGKDSMINELQQRVEALTTELGSTTNELNMLRDSQADVSRKFEEKERMLNAEITRLKDDEERYKETARFHQQDLRAQAEIAAKAQQDYEQELVKHAEAAKLLHQIRAEHNDLKTQSASWRAEAESARVSLAQSEQSWEERRRQFEQEIAELNARRDDANTQNKLLHQQLESVSAQIAALQQSRAQMDTSSDGQNASLADPATEGLRELTNYLRREKEILEVQYDMKVNEVRRLQQQFEYSQSQLDEARLKLEQERRSHADSSRSSLTHKELMDKLNELNLIRESNVTLRNENQRAQAQLEQKAKKIEELEAKVQPLEARIAELELDKQFKEAEIKQLHEARDGLQKRIESILSKYGQSDPQEVEQLKATIESLEAERDALKQSEQSLREKLAETETTLESERNKWTESRAKLVEDFKNRYRTMKTQRDEAMTEKNGLQATVDSLNERLSGVEKELGTAKQDLEEKSKQLQQQAAAAAAASAEQQTTAAPAPSEQQDSQQLEALRKELEMVNGQKAAVEAELEQVKSELATAIAERDAARAEAAAAATQQPRSGEDAEMQNGAGLSDEERKALEERIAAAEAKAAEFEAKAKELEEHADSIVKQRSEKMKTALNKKLAESKETMEKQAKEDKEKLQAEYEMKLKQELAIAKAEQMTSGPAPQNGVAPPSTPAKQQQPATGAQNSETPAGAVAATPGASLADLSKLDDTQIRDFVSNNATIMSIIRQNVSKAVTQMKKTREEAEAVLKTEYEQKIASARDQAAALTEKKSALRINMLDRQNKTAGAKLAVVETAAKETPQKPVVEVWNIAKDAKPPTPAPTPAATTPAVVPAQPVVAAAAAAAAAAPAVQANNASDATTEETKPQIIPAPTVTTGIPQPQRPASAAAAAAVPAVNPFAQPPAGGGGAAAPVVVNPFGGQPAQQQQQGQQPARTGIPVPRGGAAAGGAGGGHRGGRGGYYQAGGRGGGQGGQRGGRGGGGGNFGGRGGGAAGALNPGAGEFNPGASQGSGGPGAGNKRPRGNDGEGGQGAKRPRGGGGGAAGGAGGGQ
ncbi:nucleo protein TPR [Diplogelasinospora grovesii]|uniref:Nucleo protein TPR n=1 Tax=Diplogelasinospora grovesii TaxID=303347 RepID=A0AAN6NGU5_9PEZI|nr:nucleo protein TPR [Diplogelasinospora grovesii]